ncbi:MAG: hypothetical protein DHS20C13_30530 [Thermodesulfobacteriota bacterium]|nr:MAG: hypothetical protein DHS20C13_30530 [Thermodesulfobacteriota bacterium]
MTPTVPVIIENYEGDSTTPSHVAITSTGLRLVGKPARRYALKDVANSVFAVKRLIGRSFNDPVVQNLKKMMPYEIIKADNGDAWVRLCGEDYSPEQICAFTLQKLKASAETFLGHAVTEAVITVPAYFNDSQRQSTKDAGRMAGLEVKRIISEPTAAAITSGVNQNCQNDEVIAVYDLGGGTFDISIIETTYVEGEIQFEVLSLNGDTFLGGEDFDLKLVRHIANEFQKSSEIDLLNDPIALQRLKEAAEAAKIILSSELSTQVNLPFIATDAAGVKHLDFTISRKLFQDLIGELVDSSINICKRAVNDAELSINEERERHDKNFIEFDVDSIDRVILVGGSTRIPIIQEKIENYFGDKLHAGIRREDYVALGAAIQAGVLSGGVQNVLLLDAIPFSIGIETLGGVATWLIKRNTTFPIKADQVFSTAEDNQEAVTIHILQGDDKDAANNLSLGRFELVGIMPMPKGVPQIKVVFDIDANGILNVSAKDQNTSKEQSIVVKAKSGLSDDVIITLAEDVKNSETPSNVQISCEKSAPRINLNNFNNITDSQATFTKDVIFVSYAHEDFSWAKQIRNSLSMLAHNNGHEIWIDRMIETGDYWEERIYSKIEKSSVAILILSHDFLNSNFILKEELPRIFAEKERRYLQVFPIMVRSCPHELHVELAKFQFFNDPNEPLASLQAWEVEKVLTNLAYELTNKLEP